MHTIYHRAVLLPPGQLPSIYSEAPHIDDEGDLIDARIRVAPIEDENAVGIESVQMTFSIDEADQFARRLWQMVTDARNGKYWPKTGFDDLPPPPLSR